MTTTTTTTESAFVHTKPFKLIVDRAAPTPDRPPPFSDDHLALEFAAEHAIDLRYVAEFNKWLLWNGTIWEKEKSHKPFDHARKGCRAVAADCDDERQRRHIVSAKTVAAVVTMARTDRRIAAVSEQWDTDPWLLNTPSGVIDLRTGIMRPHNAIDYMTKITGIAPDASCPISRWLKFLDRVMAGDEEMIAFLQRVAGYCLTGVTYEHAMFFAYGTGGNGKSTFINTLARVWNDYHRAAAMQTFTESRSDHHPTDIASLHGPRLVTAIETEEGHHWAESKIKALTGGDRISARFMRQDFFEFTPQFKLLIAGNHKPRLRTVDEAIRRRFHLIPFAVTIPPEERDREMENTFTPELSGILAWMIEGCLAWQQLGLAPPKAVTEATAAYLEAEDPLAAWIEECCDYDPNSWHTSTELFTSFSGWAQKAGERIGSVKSFSQRLDGRGGIEFQRKEYGRGFWGLRLRQQY
jgi:putative DNA primase/helicase